MTYLLSFVSFSSTTRTFLVLTTIIAVVVFSSGSLLSNALIPSSSPTNHNRRQFLTIPIVAFLCDEILLSSSSSFLSDQYNSNALDMDAFINKELGNDNTGGSSKSSSSSSGNKQLSSDEALCRFGQPGKEKGDACVRAGIPISAKGGRVNAYGEIDRGTYARCRQFYELEEEGYVKKTTCE